MLFKKQSKKTIPRIWSWPLKNVASREKLVKPPITLRTVFGSVPSLYLGAFSHPVPFLLPHLHLQEVGRVPRSVTPMKHRNLLEEEPDYK